MSADLVKNLRFLRDCQLMPVVMGQDWSSLFLQEFMGDITMVPKCRPWLYTHALSDPTLAHLRWYMQRGRQALWMKLPMLRNRVSICRALESCIATIVLTQSRSRVYIRRMLRGSRSHTR